MMKEELEKRLHNIAELLYEQGFDDGKAKGLNDAMKKIKKYEQQKQAEKCEKCTKEISAGCVVDGCKFEPKQTDATDIIKVGDEVYILDKSRPKIVTSIGGLHGETVIVMTGTGCWAHCNIQELHKTGRHFPQIAEVLKLLRGEEE